MEDREMTRKGNENTIEGKGDHLKGRLKDAAGGLTGDDSMQAEGKWDQLKGKAKEKLGEAQRNLGSDRSR